ncbi:hypothetical protein A2V82_16535 [candidate division KSB1 bacterium RBG_16_48_16]|nr:MAG: hypothetical protein A2V82_16535 [candidate division KSB1 bacterium RBG_16_48_16]
MGKSNSAENAKLQYESGQTLVPMAALTDSGDHKIFTAALSPWSGKNTFAPIVRPDGVVTGGAVVPTSGQNNKVDAAALTCYLIGVLTSVSAAAGTTLTRPATNVAKVSSITVNSAGVIAVVAGTDGATQEFSETRGAAGGPPFVPVGSIEVAQVRLITSAAAVVTAAEIFTVAGQHQERYDYPVWDESNVNGAVTFSAALSLAHTGSVAKKVYAQYYTPIFADVSLASDFAPPENSYSVSSTQIYGTTLGKTAASLGQGKFTAFLSDGVTDPLVGLKGEILWFKFFPDRYKTPYMLAQGKLGISRAFPVADNIKADCTISAAEVGKEVAA